MIVEKLLKSILPGKILQVQVGMSRTAVVAETAAGITCGLAATFNNPQEDHRMHPSVAKAGQLLEMSSIDLANLINSSSLTEVTIGLATINALLPGVVDFSKQLNGHDYLLDHGRNKNIAMIGHFPFTDLLRSAAKNLWILELQPKPGDIPADRAPEYLPKADIVAITATTIINRTFDNLITYCQPESTVIMLGPSTPLSPVLFQSGISALSGTRVLNVEGTMIGIAQGSSTHQLKERGMIEYITARAEKST